MPLVPAARHNDAKLKLGRELMILTHDDDDDVCMYVWIDVRMYVRMHACACVRACVRACARARVCVRACVRACVCACVHACVRACCLLYTSDAADE